LMRGGLWVYSHVRGGGEYGPAWRQAGAGQNKIKSYEDFLAISHDLIKRGYTSSQKIGAYGGSNGGLMVAASMVLQPALFGAVFSDRPYLDMKRYTKHFVGSIYVDEYGDPDNPADWLQIKKFSPYHNITHKDRYPPFLTSVSTNDDRVNPMHARKMVARMRAMGHEAYLFEYEEGGHGNVSFSTWVTKNALMYTFFRSCLMNSN
jgi:prolyl oligopeptidase